MMPTAEEPSEAEISGVTSFDKFTERARKVLALAQREAWRAQSLDIRTEHLLFGLVAEGEGIAAQALSALGLDRVQLQMFSVTWSQGGQRQAPRGHSAETGPAVLSEESKAVIEHGIAQARRMKHAYVGTEHLLLGLLDVPECAASRLLETRGYAPEAIRAQVKHVLAQPTPASPLASTATGTKSNVVTCRLDDSTLEAVDMLVEVGIRSSRSDAVAWLITTGIDAHGDLFERIRATAGTIRQLRAEASNIAGGNAPRHSGSAPVNRGDS
jgi:ATP-dependent Clp protease ATP-binding subunit ClpA